MRFTDGTGERFDSVMLATHRGPLIGPQAGSDSQGLSFGVMVPPSERGHRGNERRGLYGLREVQLETRPEGRLPILFARARGLNFGLDELVEKGLVKAVQIDPAGNRPRAYISVSGSGLKPYLTPMTIEHSGLDASVPSAIRSVAN